nr:chorismate lyase [Halomonas xinjiangensis]
MSAAWWAWIASDDSLTARLVEAARDRPFSVRLIAQDVGRPRLDEARALAIPPSRHVWRREVALCVDDRPWVMARSVAPLEGLRGQRLGQLGERSLGSWLFSQPGLERSAIDVACGASPMPVAEPLWTRRSVFRLARVRILVQESFLSRMADDLGLPSR